MIFQYGFDPHFFQLPIKLVKGIQAFYAHHIAVELLGDIGRDFIQGSALVAYGKPFLFYGGSSDSFFTAPLRKIQPFILL